MCESLFCCDEPTINYGAFLWILCILWRLLSKHGNSTSCYIQLHGKQILCFYEFQKGRKGPEPTKMRHYYKTVNLMSIKIHKKITQRTDLPCSEFHFLQAFERRSIYSPFSFSFTCGCSSCVVTPPWPATWKSGPYHSFVWVHFLSLLLTHLTLQQCGHDQEYKNVDLAFCRLSSVWQFTPSLSV